MPVYVYEAIDPKKSCPKCRDSFEITQSIKDDKLKVCPECGFPIQRVIQTVAFGSSKTDLHYRAKRAGFKCLKKVSKGEYEKMY